MPLQPIWKEISEKEYNKYAYVPPPKNATLIQIVDAVLGYHPKFQVKREIVIPPGMGIFEQSDYVFSNEPKEYRYYKKIGDEFFFYGNADQCKKYHKLNNSK